MKIIFLILNSLVPVSVFAISLDDALSKQTQVEITPVTIDGKYIRGEELSAIGVCQALGYSRLVSYKANANCPVGEKFHTFNPEHSTTVRLTELDYPCQVHYQEALSSVVCAK